MKEYPFAANREKLQRAIASVGRDEALVKAKYIKLGGLLIEGYEPEETPEVAPEPVEPVEVEAVAEKPAKKK